MTRMRTAAVAVTMALAFITLDTGRLGAQRPPVPASLQVFKVQGNVYMIAGAGGNITVQAGPDGVVLVDAGSAEKTDDIVAAVRSITDLPIRYIINTGPGADHVGGNEKLAAAGQNIATREVGPLGPSNTSNNGTTAEIVGTEDLLTRMSDSEGGAPTGAWPTETFTTKHKDLFINREGIQVFAEPAAHSDSDAIVMFRRSDVIATGDIFDITRFPVIDVAKGGSIQGEIDALNHLIDLTIPSVPLPWLDEGGTQVIPGHGRPCEEADLVDYRDMVTMIRDRVQALIKKNMTLEQVIAANPTKGFRTRYGSESGHWTTDMFVEAVFKSLSAVK